MANKEKGVQVNATIPPTWDDLIEDHRWKVKRTKTQVIRKATEEYMVNHGLLIRDEETGELVPAYTPDPPEAA